MGGHESSGDNSDRKSTSNKTQPSSPKSGPPPPLDTKESEEGKTKWYIEKCIFHPIRGTTKSSREIPSFESLTSLLASNGVDKKERIGYWVGLRFHKGADQTSGVCLNLKLNLSTPPIKAQMVYEAMAKKLLEPDEVLTCWIDCIKELSISKLYNGGLEISIRTDLSVIGYGMLAEEIREFFLPPLEEVGVTLTEDGFSDDFKAHTPIQMIQLLINIFKILAVYYDQDE